jgi:hypothetical protein
VANCLLARSAPLPIRSELYTCYWRIVMLRWKRALIMRLTFDVNEMWRVAELAPSAAAEHCEQYMTKRRCFIFIHS